MQSNSQLKFNETIRKDINQHIKEFFERGGKITTLTQGEIAQKKIDPQQFVINPKRKQSDKSPRKAVEDRSEDL